MKITYQQLDQFGACSDALDTFQEIFGSEAEITLENCRKAYDAGLSLTWLIQKFQEPLTTYWSVSHSAYVAYNEAITGHINDYYKAIGNHENANKASEKYYAATAPFRAALHEAKTQAAYATLIRVSKELP